MSDSPPVHQGIGKEAEHAHLFTLEVRSFGEPSKTRDKVARRLGLALEANYPERYTLWNSGKSFVFMPGDLPNGTRVGVKFTTPFVWIEDDRTTDLGQPSPQHVQAVIDAAVKQRRLGVSDQLDQALRAIGR